MLTCKQIVALSGDYLENDLTFYKRVSFLLHIAMCKHCHRFIDHTKKTIELARASYKPQRIEADSETVLRNINKPE